MLVWAIGIVGLFSGAIVTGVIAFSGIQTAKPVGPPSTSSPPPGDNLIGGLAKAVQAPPAPPLLDSYRPELEKIPAPTPVSAATLAVDPKDAEAANTMLETLGTLTAAHLYQTYLNLGMLADGAEYGTYADAEARKLLATITGFIDTVDEQMAKLGTVGFEPEDRKRLQRVRGLATLLRTQATELAAYWDTPDKDKAKKKAHETKFHRARADAWIGIKEMLDIQEEPAPSTSP